MTANSLFLPRTIFNDEHEMFRQMVRKFAETEMLPHNEAWEHAGMVSRELWLKAGAQGLLGVEAPEPYGAGLRDYRYGAIISEEFALAGVASAGAGIGLHNDVVLPYLIHYANDEQKARWLPGVCSGEKILALGMTEPNAGSDLASLRTIAVRDGNHYVVNGAKTFITNGILSDIVVAAVKTNPNERHRGISLLVIERGMEGFSRGRKLDKLGQRSQDTAELFFENVHVPVANLLGREGEGFAYMMNMLPQERLSVAVGAVAASKAALSWTEQYCKDRTAFGQPIGKFQHSRFKLAEMATEIQIAETFIDRCIDALNAKTLSAETAAMAKWWTTELQGKVMDTCVQLHGGYGYMLEYPITRYYADARVQRIYAGTNEIMKEIIGRRMGF
ncbi:MAG: acyl-CoA dehydrogenase family protein [Anaerolineae bacterium]|nr:acyl-CoA dehydrogenase family protein [Anaerolineae bacterium]